MFARVRGEYLFIPLSVNRRGESLCPTSVSKTTRLAKGCELQVMEDHDPHPGYVLVQTIDGPYHGHPFYVRHDEVVIEEGTSPLVAAA